MQAGFAMLTAGAARSQNKSNIIMLTTVVDAAVCAIFYYFFGFACAYGRPWNGFVGKHNFGGWMNFAQFAEYDDEYPSARPGQGNPWNPLGNHRVWVFEWASAAAVAAIASGAMAERSQVTAHIASSAFLSGFVYPVICHWVWEPHGWLSVYSQGKRVMGVGMLDIAGSGTIHLTGAIAGFWGALILGPRLGFSRSKSGYGGYGGASSRGRGHGRSSTLVVLGTLLLWLGWYGIYPGSILGIVPRHYTAMKGVVNRAAITTTLAGAASAIATFFVRRWLTGSWKVEDACGGLVGGLVAASAGCAVIEPSAGMLLGVIAALVLIAVKRLAKAVGLDDPMEALQRHGACGLVGLLFVGVFATEDYVMQMFGDDELPDETPCGWLYGKRGRKLLAAQAIGAACIVGWTSVAMAPLFLLLRIAGLLRISREEEAARFGDRDSDLVLGDES
ncbi:hypothetical protein CBR_g37114 [Chara braunii]|uniref:Ammonium transporter AmtB-like domain-containing protein n=1 Tax=Chara braunii TaxID=69332 RepID=A0A388LM47_CHABU|nr:hypothetical protein CBR_g37114 [Chara braunii]|eukprot:GBG83400.1 hypothetical protein CBR_g37114 [Chara braunii]